MQIRSRFTILLLQAYCSEYSLKFGDKLFYALYSSIYDKKNTFKENHVVFLNYLGFVPILFVIILWTCFTRILVYLVVHSRKICVCSVVCAEISFTDNYRTCINQNLEPCSQRHSTLFHTQDFSHSTTVHIFV